MKNKITPIIYKEFNNLFNAKQIKSAQKIVGDALDCFNLTKEEAEFLSNFIWNESFADVSKGFLKMVFRDKIMLTCGEYLNISIIAKSEYHSSIFSWLKDIKIEIINAFSNQKYTIPYSNDINLVQLYQSINFFNNLCRAKIQGKFKGNDEQLTQINYIYETYEQALTDGDYNLIISLLKYLPFWVEDVNKKDIKSWNNTYQHNKNLAILLGLFNKNLITKSTFDEFCGLTTTENLKQKILQKINYEE